MEMFDILDINGNKTGKIKERSLVHKDGDWHASVHVWIARRIHDKTEVMMQKRSLIKDSYPGIWDAACTGHVDAGEDYITGALREVKEELGIEVRENDLEFLFQQNNTDILDINQQKFISNEVNQVFMIIKNISLEDVKWDENEISEIKWIELEKVRDMIEHKESCIKKEEYLKVSFVLKG